MPSAPLPGCLLYTSYIADALRSAIPGYTLDEVFDNKDLIAQNVKDSVTELMAGYGYDIITTLITDIELPKDVERSMNCLLYTSPVLAQGDAVLVLAGHLARVAADAFIQVNN